MRLEGSKLDGAADAGALDEGRKLGLFEDMVEGSDLGCEGNLPLSNAQQTRCERTGHHAAEQRYKFAPRWPKGSIISIGLACRTSFAPSYAESKSTTAASRSSSGSHHQGQAGSIYLTFGGARQSCAIHRVRRPWAREVKCYGRSKFDSPLLFTPSTPASAV
jgi:hypothetical protein